MSHRLVHKTVLKDRELWFDGESSHDPAKLFRAKRAKYVTKVDQNVRTYNRAVTKDNKLIVREECPVVEVKWNLPEEFACVNVIDHIIERHYVRFGKLRDFEAREKRLIRELIEFRSRGLEDVLRALMTVVSSLKAGNHVWGVGRGSSVSSYTLYVIEIHDVDSYSYDLEFSDFMHD